MNAMTQKPGIPIPHQAIAQFCRERGIRRLALYGSVLRDVFGPDSDVDVLVEFEPDRVPGLFALVDYEIELSKLLERQVDLRTPAGLSRYFRDEVLAEARDVYVAP